MVNQQLSAYNLTWNPVSAGIDVRRQDLTSKIDLTRNPFSAGIDARRQDLTSKIDPSTERVADFNGLRGITQVFK